MRLAAAWHRVFSVPGQKQSKRRRREAQAAAAVPRGRPIRGATRSAGRKVRVQSPAPAPTVRRASPKVLLAAAALLVLASIGIGVAVAVSGGSSRSTADLPRRGSLVNALPGAGGVHRLFAGIPQRGNELGRSSAPVTLVEYIDPQCPYCREFVATALPRLVTRYVRSGKLRIEARPIAILGPDSLRGNRAIVAAGQQGRLFNVAELLYFNQGGGEHRLAERRDDHCGSREHSGPRRPASAGCPRRGAGRRPVAGTCLPREGGRSQPDADNPHRQNGRAGAAGELDVRRRRQAGRLGDQPRTGSLGPHRRTGGVGSAGMSLELVVL